MPKTLRYGPFLLLDAQARRRLRASACELHLREGDVLIRERGADKDAYVLVDGCLRVVAHGEGRTLAMVGAPALVGEMAVVTDAERSATVVADTACTVLRLPGEELRVLMEGQPLFATAMRERTDLLLADAFLKRHSPLRDLPAGIVGTLVTALRPRDLAPDQLVEGRDDDLYLVRRGALERLRDGARTEPGDFLQRERGERYAAVGETSIYELRMADVASEIVRHQDHVRSLAARLGDGARVRTVPNVVTLPASDLGGVLVHDGSHRAVVSEPVAALVPRLDGGVTLETLVRDSGHPRGEIAEGVAMLVAAGLAELRD